MGDYIIHLSSNLGLWTALIQGGCTGGCMCSVGGGCMDAGERSVREDACAACVGGGCMDAGGEV